MKFSHKALLVVISIILIFALAACGPKKPPTGPPGSDSLKPSDIKHLPDLTNYALSANHHSPAAVTYTAGTQAEEEKLDNRIAKKKNDPDYDELSSVVKIFANSDGSEIIEAMRVAALPYNKMTQVIDYLAGETDVTSAQIEDKVASGEKPSTPGWSFFDDYDYYEKLKEEADNNPSDKADDNVKRQYRNMAGKIFGIGMSGDEFARVLIYEVVYAIKVVEKMSNAAFNADPTNPSSDEFWNYCKEELDYDLLVYFLAFSDYYRQGAEIARSVRLYGYYYDYEKRVYEETSDEEFEKQLKYGHMTTYTNAEWADYVTLQRKSYENTYRYSDSFYEKSFYPVHLAFQEVKENRENEVYGINQHNNMSYTDEMRKGMTNNGFAGQLKMTDWLWCYGGDSAKMNAYNQANTDYENGKNQGAENAAKGEYYYNKEQLKISNYLLTNMTNTELGNALRYQIYNYSSDMVSSIQNHKKDIVLLVVDKIEPDEYIYTNGYAADLTGAKDYAKGKIEAIIDQMGQSLSDANVKTKAEKASSESWATMNKEIENALDEANYASIPVYGTKDGKLQRQKDLVIKRIFQPCRLGLDEEGCRHIECTKEYDTRHSISQFAHNYATILQRVSGRTVLTFKTPSVDYNLDTLPNGVDSRTYGPIYHQGTHLPLESDMAASKNDFKEYQEITIKMGEEFKQGVLDASIDSDDDVPSGTTEGQNWWDNHSTPAKAEGNIEVTVGINRVYYKYEYTTFVGWYLDSDLKYKLEESDEVNCDLVLYAGYIVKQTRVNK
ncbi:MAG: hypothetical protein GX242_06070 [Clostridiales bacterium]|nr:hypothetical protein [Clostridiales bacterium]